MTTQIAHNQPDWCCDTCGTFFGRWYIDRNAPSHHTATYSLGVCDVCGQTNVPVTEARDFGYLVPGWDEQQKYRRVKTPT